MHGEQASATGCTSLAGLTGSAADDVFASSLLERFLGCSLGSSSIFAKAFASELCLGSLG